MKKIKHLYALFIISAFTLGSLSVEGQTTTPPPPENNNINPNNNPAPVSPVQEVAPTPPQKPVQPAQKPVTPAPAPHRTVTKKDPNTDANKNMFLVRDSTIRKDSINNRK